MQQALSGYRAWKTAARVHTLPAAIVPVLVGSGLAVGDGVFRWDAFIWALLGALAIQVAANFANDASDAKRGVDTSDRVGPPRMVALGIITPGQMWVATWVAIAVAAVSAVALTFITGPIILVIGFASVIAMLGYVGGPIPYGYRGLGEVFVFLFFGLVATVGSRFIHDGTAPLSAWLLAVPVGLLAVAILVVNNYRDLDTDNTTGKRTLAVIMGRPRTRRFYAALVSGAFVLILGYEVLGWTPRWTGLALLAAPLSWIPISTVSRHDAGAELIGALRWTARLHLLVGVLLAIGAGI